MQIIQSIQNRIYELRGERVVLDFDLAALYDVEARVLNQAVSRNIKRFPDDFMFRLTKEEFENLRLHVENLNQSKTPPIAVKSLDNNPSSQFVMIELPKNRTGKYLPYAFTEQGVAMLSGVLNSDKAIKMNIAIMRTFVAIRKIIFKQSDLKEQLIEIKERLGEHDVQLNHIYEAMENLLDEKAAQRKWEERSRIGFKK